jgi:hypothetical protein
MGHGSGLCGAFSLSFFLSLVLQLPAAMWTGKEEEKNVFSFSLFLFFCVFG